MTRFRGKELGEGVSLRHIKPNTQLSSIMNNTSTRGLPLLASQSVAYERVIHLLRAGVAGSPIDGHKIRTYPLLIASSGSGKTEIVRRACQELNFAMCHLTALNWVIYAAKKPGTIEGLSTWIESLKRPGLVFIDELDKLRLETISASSWHMDGFTEILALLDGDHRLTSLGMKPSVVKRIGKDIFFAGAGAWQALFRQGTRRSMSFGEGFIESASTSHATAALKDAAQGGVPEEVLNRFATPVVISPLTSKDYEEAIQRLHEYLVEPMPEPEALHKLSAQAVTEGLGFRWIERYLTDLAVERVANKEVAQPVHHRGMQPLNGHKPDAKIIADLEQCYSETEFAEYMENLHKNAEKEEDDEDSKDKQSEEADQLPGIIDSPKKEETPEPSELPAVAKDSPVPGDRIFRITLKDWKLIGNATSLIMCSACVIYFLRQTHDSALILTKIGHAALKIHRTSQSTVATEEIDPSEAKGVFTELADNTNDIIANWKLLKRLAPELAEMENLELWCETLDGFVKRLKQE